MTTRRSFLGSILAAATPPGFVRAGVLMPVAPLIIRPMNELAPARNWDGQRYDVRVVQPPAADLEAQARAMFATFMAAKMDSMLHQAMTGQLGRNRA